MHIKILTYNRQIKEVSINFKAQVGSLEKYDTWYIYAYIFIQATIAQLI